MTHSPEMPEVPIRPHEVTAAEVVPGDLFALTPEDAAERRWHVVTHTLPASPEVIRVTLRPPLGGVDHEEDLRRERTVTVAGRRVDVDAVPLVEPESLEGVEFRDGDRLTVLRAVDPLAAEVTYVRRWGAWHRDTTESADAQAATDAEVRRWAADAAREGTVVRHEPRPVRQARAAGPRR
ncbi:3-oxoacyl-ACP synthase, partial [Actinospica acidiphila]|nr:3-oxoacyl-ACP synthase [Actinospica acidiphila]